MHIGTTKGMIMDERQREEFVKGWNMLGRPANDPEFLRIMRTFGEALDQWPRPIQYCFIRISEPQGGEEIKFFAEQCAVHCSEEMKQKLLAVNYVIFNLIVARVHRELQKALREGTLAPK
jgi:hypothetical protein